MKSVGRNAKTALSVLLLLVAGCKSKPPGEHVTTGPAIQEPILPPGYQKIAPAAADDSRGMLAQTATIFRGSLKNVQFTYDGCSGPRTKYVFSDSSSLLGAAVESTVTLKVLGGPTPTGRWLGVSEIPRLALDSEYVVFLRNTDWTLSPVVGNLVFRIETIGGREMLIDPGGHAVTGWGPEGPSLSTLAVTETVGSKRRAYKTPPTPDSRGQINPNHPAATASSQASQSTSAPSPSDVPDSLLTRAPSIDEIRRAGLFARPALIPAAISNEPSVSIVSFLAAARDAAAKAQLDIGGRLTLDPKWKCWSSTPTAMVRR